MYFLLLCLLLKVQLLHLFLKIQLFKYLSPSQGLLHWWETGKMYGGL